MCDEVFDARPVRGDADSKTLHIGVALDRMAVEQGLPNDEEGAVGIRLAAHLSRDDLQVHAALHGAEHARVDTESGHVDPARAQRGKYPRRVHSGEVNRYAFLGEVSPRL